VDRLFTIADAFSLEPLSFEGVKPFELGGRVYPVPPLTLGRFLKLQGFDAVVLSCELLGQPLPEGAPSVSIGQMLAALGEVPAAETMLTALIATLRLAGSGKLDVACLADLVTVLVPGVDSAAWREHGTGWHVSALITLFGRGHDWGYISGAIHFGEKPEDEERSGSLEGGLVAVSQMYPSEGGIEGNLNTRLEGFYRRIDAIIARQKDEAEKADPNSVDPSSVMTATRDPERYEHIKELMFASEEKAKAEDGD
jgi:hypothetical protein